MNRRDFDVLARAFRSLETATDIAPLARWAVAERVADFIAAENSNFDRTKFMHRCGFGAIAKREHDHIPVAR